MKFCSGCLILFFYLSIFFAPRAAAQHSGSLTPYGDIRLAYVGSGTSASGLGGNTDFMRIRAGLQYHINENNRIAGRGVYIFSRDVKAPVFSLWAKSSLPADTFSFDEAYYMYHDDKQLLKAGRFQKSFSLPTAAFRSLSRVQSKIVTVDWTDGLHYQRQFKNGWLTDFVAEYQKRGHLSYPYHAPLTFGKNEHNVINYLGLTNKNRDRFSIIEKNIAVMWAPAAFRHNGVFKSYLSLNASAAFDFPFRERLSGGSLRITGEAGQNLMADITNGSAFTASASLHNIAERHFLIAEFARIGKYWLTAPYPSYSHITEFRYRFIYSPRLNLEIRYMINNSRAEGAAVKYSTFIRTTYSF